MPGGDQARTAVPNMVDSLAITSDIDKEGVIPCQAGLAEELNSKQEAIARGENERSNVN